MIDEIDGIVRTARATALQSTVPRLALPGWKLTRLNLAGLKLTRLELTRLKLSGLKLTGLKLSRLKRELSVAWGKLERSASGHRGLEGARHIRLTHALRRDSLPVPSLLSRKLG